MYMFVIPLKPDCLNPYPLPYLPYSPSNPTVAQLIFNTEYVRGASQSVVAVQLFSDFPYPCSRLRFPCGCGDRHSDSHPCALWDSVHSLTQALQAPHRHPTQHPYRHRYVQPVTMVTLRGEPCNAAFPRATFTE